MINPPPHPSQAACDRYSLASIYGLCVWTGDKITSTQLSQALLLSFLLVVPSGIPSPGQSCNIAFNNTRNILES